MVSNVERWKGCRCVAAGVKMDPPRFVRLKLPEKKGGGGESGRNWAKILFERNSSSSY